MKKKSFSVLKVLGPQQCKTRYVFTQVSHSNEEESTISSEEGSEITMAGQHSGG